MADAARRETVRAQLEEAIRVEQLLLSDGYVGLVAETAAALVDVFKSGHKLLCFGNGGSSAQAQHLAGEFVGRFAVDRAPLPALALTESPPAVTAISNDYGYDEVFARQVEALGVAGDVAIGLSTSGTSANVVAALARAKSLGLRTVALTGPADGPLTGLADYCLQAPGDGVARIQEAHLVIGHILCQIVEEELFSAAATDG